MFTDLQSLRSQREHNLSQLQSDVERKVLQNILWSCLHARNHWNGWNDRLKDTLAAKRWRWTAFYHYSRWTSMLEFVDIVWWLLYIDIFGVVFVLNNVIVKIKYKVHWKWRYFFFGSLKYIWSQEEGSSVSYIYDA